MKIDRRQIGWAWLAFLALEIISFNGSYNAVAFGILVASAFALTIWRTEYGLLLLFGELFIGSMGHLFYLDFDGTRLPIRIGLFVAVMTVYGLKLVIQLIQEKGRARYWRQLVGFPGRRPYLFLFGAIAIGLIVAFVRQNSPASIFDDANGWIYFLVLFPALAVYSEAGPDAAGRLKNLFLAAAAWLSLKTLFILFMFAHNASLAPALYYWLRRILGGEVTVGASGWPRAFIQGQIYCGLAYLLAFWLRPVPEKMRDFFRPRSLALLLLGGFFLSTIVISLSRSFWVGIAAAASLSLLAAWRLESWRSLISGAAWFIMTAVISLGLIYGLLAIPYSQSPTASLGSSLFDRVTGDNEPAVASRWSLLPVLGQAIAKEPVFGQGFGATVTYFSRDPRVLALSPSGEYTTNAFEWGYLDIWLKLGLVGLAAYLFLLYAMLWEAWRQGRNGAVFYVGLAAGLIFVAATNFFTPYLNHPLGIGFVVLTSCLIWANKVY